MFGQSSNTPFGGGVGGFGQPTNTAPGGFGAPAGGVFANPAPAPFGAPPTPAFGGGFGAPAPSPGFFGSPAPAQTGFGAPAPAAGFGAPAAGFGAAAPTAFGAPAPSAFGAPATNAFGAPPAPFGAPAPAPLFGGAAPAAGGFLGAPAPTPFGAPAPAAGGMFGAPAPAPGANLFGAPAPAFGAAPSAFGSPAPTPFGAPAAGTSLFGTPAAAPFGAPPATGFGAAPAPTAFGAPPAGGLFGAPATTPGSTFGAPGGTAFGTPMGGGSGTRAAPYTPTSKVDGSTNITFQSISAMAPYQQKSAEELRIEDYAQGNKGTPVAQNTVGGFGAPAPAAGGNLFGAPAAGGFGAPAPGAFGAPAPSAFGAPAPTAFGSPSPAPGLFGQPPAPPTAFGAPSAFGAPAGGFGAPAPAPGLFGAPAPGGFGSPAPAPFGAPAPLFGGAPAPSPGIFGSAAPAPTGNLFGQPAPAPSLFGQPAPSAFGQPAPAPLFSTSPAPAFGAPAPGMFGQPAPAPSLFGQPAPASGMFGQSSAPYALQSQQPVFPPNAQIVPQAANEVLQHQIQALHNQVKEVEQIGAWERKPRSPVTTLTSYPESAGHRQYTPYTPSTRVRPRGFPTSNTPSSTTKGPLLHQTASPPAAALQVQPLAVSGQLHVRSDAVRTPSKFMLALEDSSAVPQFAESVDHPPPPTPEGASRALQSETTIAAQNPKSPGQLYYEEVTGVPAQEETSPAGSPNKKNTKAPTLTKDGYEIYPSLATLETMDTADLAAVPDFAVSRPGCGKVEWEGCVDVRDADLDSIVVIEKADISVYHDHEERDEKPLEGRKLNRPALLTFYNIFPKDGPRASVEAKERFQRKLESQSAKMGGEYVSYDKDAGVWKFRVLHFSRYCLEDDSSEDGDSLVLRNSPVSTPHRSSVNEGNPYGDENMAMDATPISDIETSEYEEDGAYADAEVAAQRLTRSILQSRPEEEELMLVDMTHEFEKGDFDQPETDEESQCSSVHLFEHCRPCVSVLPGLGLKMSPAQPLVSTRPYCGRVGFAPNGSIFSISQSRFTTTHAVFGQPSVSQSSALLDCQRHCATHQTTVSPMDGCPLFSLGSKPNSDLADSLAACTSGNAKHVFELVSNLRPVNEENIENHDISMSSRMIMAARNLLSGICAADASSLSTNPISQTCAALANGDIEQAVQSARNANYRDIAAILASGDCSEDLNNFQASKKRALRCPAEPVSTQVYPFFSSDYSYSGPDGPQSHWYQVLNRWMARDTDQSLQQLMKRYEEIALAGSVPFPSPSYKTGSDKPGSVVCFYFKLLQFYAENIEISFPTLLDPKGYTKDVADYELAFHVAAAMRATGKWQPSDGDNEVLFDRIADAYQTQLCATGLWDQAVFVALCSVQDDVGYAAKVRRAKALVLRFYNGIGEDQVSARQFLEDLGVPSAWFVEAAAVYSSSIGDVEGCLQNALDMSPDAGLSVFEEALVPSLNFDSKILKELAHNPVLASDTGNDASLGKLVVSFGVLEEEVGQLIANQTAKSQAEREKVLEEISRLQSAFAKVSPTSSRSSSQRIGAIAPLATQPSVELIVQEIQSLLDHDKQQIKALLHSQ